MKIHKVVTSVFVVMISMTIGSLSGAAQSSSAYQHRSQAERSAFVAVQARRIAKELSGRDYEFTPQFEEDIQLALNSYTARVEAPGNRNIRVALERGRSHAPTLMAPFRARNLSPLLGLYIPFIESEFVNLDASKPMGAVGMFQFMPQTGERYGLSVQDLQDVAKSADAAARFMNDNLNVFSSDPMKEALALLSYNRGAGSTLRDVKLLVNDQNRQCSICVLNASRLKLDNSFQQESVYYVPRFFAAAIIGENPQSFGLQMQPLSSN